MLFFFVLSLVPSCALRGKISYQTPLKEVAISLRSQLRCWKLRLERWLETDVAPRPFVEPSIDTSMLKRIERVTLTDCVARQLFNDYLEHRASPRGQEETGWIMLGLRELDSAIVLALLPAGANRDAGRAHVRFNSEAQALATRIVRQADRRLTILGVAHTHPGQLRRPSSGDYDGDAQWVKQLRGGDGIFAIGTFDAKAKHDEPIAILTQPNENVQQFHGLRLDWYALSRHDDNYRTLPIEISLGPDLATSLRTVWNELEDCAASLDRLCRQLAQVKFEVVEGPALACRIRLSEPTRHVRVLIQGKTVRYFYEEAEQTYEVEPNATSLEQGLFQLLAELARRDETNNDHGGR